MDILPSKDMYFTRSRGKVMCGTENRALTSRAGGPSLGSVFCTKLRTPER